MVRRQSKESFSTFSKVPNSLCISEDNLILCWSFMRRFGIHRAVNLEAWDGECRILWMDPMFNSVRHIKVRWMSRFNGGLTRTEDEFRSGRPLISMTNENVRKVEATSKEGPYVIVRETNWTYPFTGFCMKTLKSTTWIHDGFQDVSRLTIGSWKRKKDLSFDCGLWTNHGYTCTKKTKLQWANKQWSFPGQCRWLKARFVLLRRRSR